MPSSLATAFYSFRISTSSMSLPYATPTAIPLGSFAARASPSASFATLSLEETVSQQNTNLETGLNHQEVAYRQRIHGPNELTVEDGETIWSKFVDQFKNPLILLLLGSAGLSVLLGEIDDAVSISLVCSLLRRKSKISRFFPKIICHWLSIGYYHRHNRWLSK